MRVVMVNNYLYVRGGSERVMFEEANALGNEHVQVFYFGQQRADDPPLAHSDLFPPYIDPLTLPTSRKLAYAPQVIYNRGVKRRFERFLDRVRPDIIHAHNIYGGLTTAVCDVSRMRGIPMVLTLHDYKLVCASYTMRSHGQVCDRCQHGQFYHCVTQGCHKDSRLYSLLYTLESYFNRWLQKYASIKTFICPSHFLAGLIEHSWLAHPHVVYLPNSVKCQRAQPVTAGQYALFVGRLSPEKGAMTLLRAVASLQGIPLHVVGDGPMREQLVDYTEQLHCQDRIIFRGYLQGEALAEAYRQAAMLVIPSEGFENAPMSVLEAMACGKPIIGTQIGGIPELVRHEENGLVYEPGDIDTLRAHLERLWTHPTERMAMGQQSRQMIEQQYSLQQHGSRLLDIYQQAVA
ncbi:MAG TPA: glycosyltransferase family 4 protein [Armatimonadota bacterium]|jgi:glycosyltransferase involved in cell wall biosynthesis